MTDIIAFGSLPDTAYSITPLIADQYDYYTLIVDTALAYADRQDQEVKDRMLYFMRVVEGRINRRLQTREMSKRSFIVTNAGKEHYCLPEDFAGLRHIEVRDAPGSYSRLTPEFATPEYMTHIVASYTNSGSPTKLYYSIISDQLHIFPKLDGLILGILYYQKLTPLTPTTPKNWLSYSNPDCYLFGIMVEISYFVKDPETAAVWENRFQQALAEIELNDAIDRWSGPTPTMRAM